MNHFLFYSVVIILFAHNIWAQEDNDYWSKIKELTKTGNPQGTAELKKYLKSLTKDQTLTALRQYSKIVEAKNAVDEWPQLMPNVAFIMGGYPEPPRISAEELAKLPDRERRNYQEGSVPGLLSQEAFDKLLAGIGDRKECDFFRYALASWAAIDEDISPDLSKAQKEHLLDTYLSVVNDRHSPEVVRRACCDVAMRTFGREYRRIIYADDVVKELMRTGTPEQRRNLYALLNSGGIKPTGETTKHLAPWKRRIQDFRKALVALQQDEGEPKSLKEQAKRAITSLDSLLLIPTESSPSNAVRE